MADVLYATTDTAQVLYFQMWSSAGTVWNGAAFESYNASNWSTYNIAMTEKGSSKVYAGTLPTLTAGLYIAWVFQRIGASNAVGDTIIGPSLVDWSGSAVQGLNGMQAAIIAACATVSAATILGAVSSTGEKIAPDSDGAIEANNATAIATAVWASGTRTLTSFGTLVADTATAVWAAGTRTLTSISALTGGIVTAVWAAGSRTLTAFGFSPSITPDVTDAVATIAKLDTMLEGSGPYDFTADSLVNAPTGGDATAANQATIIADIGALNDLSSAQVAAAVQGTVIDGALTLQTVLKTLRSAALGKSIQTATDPHTIQYYAADGTTLLFTLTIPVDQSQRTVA